LRFKSTVFFEFSACDPGLEKKPTRVPGEEDLRYITTIQAINQSIKTRAAVNLA